MCSWCFVAIAHNTLLQNVLHFFVILEKKQWYVLYMYVTSKL